MTQSEALFNEAVKYIPGGVNFRPGHSVPSEAHHALSQKRTRHICGMRMATVILIISVPGEPIDPWSQPSCRFRSSA